MSYVLIFLAFVAGFMLVAGINMMLFDVAEDRRRQIRQKLMDDTRLRHAERARNSMTNREVYEMAVEGFADPDAQLGLIDHLRRFVAQSGVSAQPGQIILATLGLTLVGGLATWYLTKTPVLGLLAAAALGTIPFGVVSFSRAQRRKKLLGQLPDAYEMMARVLRAGQTIPQAMRGVADEFSSPLAEEFAYCWEQQNLGLSPEASLRELARRTGILEVKIFVVALMIHRQTGGNLSHLLHKLSKVIRERTKVRGKIDALTAEGKFQAYILFGLPFAIGAAISIVNPNYMEPLLRFPWVFLIVAIFMVSGLVWMQRIINFDF